MKIGFAAFFCLLTSTLAMSQDAPLEVGPGVPRPRWIKGEQPVHPRIAQQARIQGFLVMKVVVNPEGRIVDIRPLRSTPVLEQAAVEAMKTWRYEPTLIDGIPKAVTFNETIDMWLSSDSAFDYYSEAARHGKPVGWRTIAIERLTLLPADKRKNVLKLLGKLLTDKEPQVAQAAKAAMDSIGAVQ